MTLNAISIVATIVEKYMLVDSKFSCRYYVVLSLVILDHIFIHFYLDGNAHSHFKYLSYLSHVCLQQKHVGTCFCDLNWVSIKSYLSKPAEATFSSSIYFPKTTHIDSKVTFMRCCCFINLNITLQSLVLNVFSTTWWW